MKRAQLAGTLDVTVMGLGTAPLGGLFAPVSDADAEATIERAWSLGVRYFDTAPLYGFGLAERRLGHFLRHQERESFAVSTKVGRLLRPSGGWYNAVGVASITTDRAGLRALRRSSDRAPSHATKLRRSVMSA